MTSQVTRKQTERTSNNTTLNDLGASQEEALLYGAKLSGRTAKNRSGEYASHLQGIEAQKLADTRTREIKAALEVVEPIATPDDDTTYAAYEQDQVTALCKSDLNFLAAMCMPQVFKYFFPPVFLSAWLLLTTKAHLIRDFTKLAIGLPRGFGKTTWIKLFAVYCILFTRKKFIVVISKTEAHAANAITDIVNMLSEPNIVAAFGDWRIGIQKNNATEKIFGFRGRTIILMAFGVGGAIRGLNTTNERPDLMIFEDIQSREVANSKEQSNELEAWMYGTAIKAKSPHGCLFVFIANMYPTKWSILRKLKVQPAWTKFIVGGILADGTSLWEELQPLQHITVAQIGRAQQ